MRGHSVIELMLTVVIFSIFLLALTSVFSTGLKSWNLVQNKTETQQEASLCNMFLAKDLRQTDKSTAEIGGKGYEYAILQSNTNEFGVQEYDHATGKPKWQAYILYYTFPRNSDPNLAININFTDPNYINLRKKLIRKVIKHTAFVNTKLANITQYFNDIDVKIPGETYIGKPKVLSRHIYEMNLLTNSNNANAIDITIIISKSITEDRQAYTKDFSDGVGIEKIIIKNTVLLNNTQ